MITLMAPSARAGRDGVGTAREALDHCAQPSTTGITLKEHPSGQLNTPRKEVPAARLSRTLHEAAGSSRYMTVQRTLPVHGPARFAQDTLTVVELVASTMGAACSRRGVVPTSSGPVGELGRLAPAKLYARRRRRYVAAASSPSRTVSAAAVCCGVVQTESIELITWSAKAVSPAQLPVRKAGSLTLREVQLLGMTTATGASGGSGDRVGGRVASRSGSLHCPSPSAFRAATHRV
mmetsp:Transcript_4848/g.16010  ORF Transcript_4848/g.16010 Transcript_4848/m.16010 type:complete len:235 (+) Transcript_4848:356-1060(+)